MRQKKEYNEKVEFIKHTKGEIMEIRLAKDSDVKRLAQLLEGVQQLHAEGRPDIFRMGTAKYSDQKIMEIINDKTTPVYVAVIDDNVIGYAFCEIKIEKGTNNLYERKTFYIDDLCVDSVFRGRGIGKKLYEHAKKTAKEQGCFHLTLNVWHLNENALRFYEKCGMKPLKTTMETLL